ncbi:hypothetical protein CSA_004751 [Cucumis sativus]|uniref:Uncharacterized protein n=1 Tax=Cucumis sativus TaxID=3659 RepID=A0ACB6HC60_CUCSA|nr:hypothetical protein CSA_004751 [Cucumis sativus]
MSEQAQPNFMTKAFEKISKGTIDPTLFQHKGVGNEGQDNVALTPLIINGVEGVKALAQAKKETKLKERKELLNKVEKVTLSVKKGKAKKTHSEEYDKEMEKELEDESPLDDEVAKPSKKKKVTIKKKVLNMQFVERQERFSK